MTSAAEMRPDEMGTGATDQSQFAPEEIERCEPAKRSQTAKALTHG